MAASDYYPKRSKAHEVDDGMVTVKDRIWKKLTIWRMAKAIASHAPENVEQVGTVAVPIRELAQLRQAIQEYEDASDAVVYELSFWDRLSATVRIWAR